jgi:curli production assembly/transport component CsgG
MFRKLKWNLIFLITIVSCSPAYYQSLDTKKAELGHETPEKSELLKLPKPKDEIVVAVYKFRDQTGQYKESNVGSSWSTAVTQGATNILIRALEESGWFMPIERENIANLLNERKIIRSSRAQYKVNDPLPPLLFAGIILEGGVVSYETNIYTGGAGVRYFGTGADAQYREDRISIYLRAVSTSTGKILKTVYTTKSVLSQEVSAGVFRYVKFKHLLEAEIGYTYNEPTEIAVTEAIEKAVHSLIIEGILNNLWTVKDQNDLKSDEIKKYLKEKEETLSKNDIGVPFDRKLRSFLNIGLSASAQTYFGDYSSTLMRGGGNASVGVRLNKSLFIETNIGTHNLAINNVLNTYEYYTDLSLKFLANHKGKFSPYLSFGGGMYYNINKNVGLSDNKTIPYMTFNTGLEYLAFKNVAFNVESFINKMLYDSFDGQITGQFNDNVFGFKLGVKFYLKK